MCAEPKEHKHFRPGARAGRIGDRADREMVYVPNVYVKFLAPVPCFFGLPCFLFARNFRFLRAFSFFPRDFRGSALAFSREARTGRSGEELEPSELFFRN